MADLLFTKLVIDNQNFVIPDASAGQKGLMSSSDYSKLATVSSNAEPNVISEIQVAGTKINPNNKVVNITGLQPALTAGTGISIQNNTIACTLDTTIAVVVSSLPSAPETGNENKIHMVANSDTETNNEYIEYIWKNSKWEMLGKKQVEVSLEGYAKTTELYSHPTGKSATSGLYKITVDENGHVTGVVSVDKNDITALGIPGQDTTYSEASASAAGLMSSSDYQKLSGIAAGANKVTYSHDATTQTLTLGGIVAAAS